MTNLTEYFDSITDRLGYRSKGGDNLLLVEELPKLIAALKRLLAEIERSTDKAFVEHCEKKISEILGVE